MTRAELLAILTQKKSEDVTEWDAVITVEEATGNLQYLQSRKIAGGNQYDTAAIMLASDPPNVTLARQALQGALAVELARGGLGATATATLVALDEFIATPPVLDADITEAPDTAAGTGTVV